MRKCEITKSGEQQGRYARERPDTLMLTSGLGRRHCRRRTGLLLLLRLVVVVLVLPLLSLLLLLRVVVPVLLNDAEGDVGLRRDVPADGYKIRLGKL